MFRLSFDLGNLEKDEHPFVFVPTCANMFLYTQPVFMRTQACSCTRVSVLLFMACSFQPTHLCKILSSQLSSYARIGRNPSLGIWTPFSSVCNFNIIPHYFRIQLYVPCHISSCCESNITFSLFFSPNHEFNLILHFRFYLHILAKGVPARYWYGIVSLSRKLGVTFVLWALSPFSACYLRGLLVLSWHRPYLRGGGTLLTPFIFLIEADFMHHPQGTTEEYAQMARVFLQYLLGAYLFEVAGPFVGLREGSNYQIGARMLGLLLFFLEHSQSGDSMPVSRALEAP